MMKETVKLMTANNWCRLKDVLEHLRSLKAVTNNAMARWCLIEIERILDSESGDDKINRGCTED
jgi:hypothetical protein